jgi:thymidylate kinase
MIVSFSGIDGAGKSTQIGALQDWLAKSGLRVKLLTFWDNVVAFPQFREVMSHAAFRGDKGIGTPEKPLHRRDKNVKSWPVSVMRFGLYFADAVNLCRVVRSIRKSDTDVVIFDRYIYDELANLPLNRWLTRAFIESLLKLVPKPDIAYLIDADPVAARTRKPEYPLEFLRTNREAYLALSRLTGAITVIEPLPIDVAERKVKEAFLQKLPVPDDGLSRLPVLP